MGRGGGGKGVCVIKTIARFSLRQLFKLSFVPFNAAKSKVGEVCVEGILSAQAPRPLHHNTSELALKDNEWSRS